MRTTLCRTILALFLALSAPAAHAAVASASSYQDYTANGATVAFSFTFPATSTAWIETLVGGVKQTSGVTVALNANQTTSPGGTVTFAVAPANLASVRIQRTVPLTQELVLQPYSAFPAKTVERTLDRLVFQGQQLDRTHADDRAAQATKDAAQDATIALKRNTSDQAVRDAGQDEQINMSRGTNGYAAVVDASTVLATGASASRTLADHMATITPPADASPMQITKADGTTSVGRISTKDTYSGTGTGLTGAPRLVLGMNAPSGDDSALLISRNLTGDSLFSHAIRDETTFNTTTTGAYASFDSNPVMNGTIHYNHFRSFQARPTYTGSGNIDEVNGVSSTMQHQGAGTVSNLYGLHISNATGTGPIQNQYGIRIDPLTKGVSNVGIFVDANDNYLLGKLQIAGDLTGVVKMTATGQVKAPDINATGTPTAYETNGGLGLYGYASNGYAVIKAYSNASGTGKNLSLQPTGGLVGIGTTAPGQTLTVNGTFSFAGNGGPPGPTDACNTGTITWDSGYIYVCIATNTWRRAALTAW